MEGYHIRSLHKNSFYPYGFDNTNLVENYGPNSRITFPFRRIDKLRDVHPDDRRIDGLATSVYTLFPNVVISVLSKHTTMTVFEPQDPSQTQMIVYRMLNRTRSGETIDIADVERDVVFVRAAGFDEDREAACAIQNGLASQANQHLTFGHFEKAIVQFHQNLAKHLDVAGC